MPSTPETASKPALTRVLQDRPFLVHLAAYVGVNLLLIVIDLTTSPGTYWFQWPLLGWGLGILGHGVAVARAPLR